MTVERALRLIAGAFVALSVLLGIYVNANFLWFTLFVGLNLFQSAFTNWCPMMVILRKGGLPDATARGRQSQVRDNATVVGRGHVTLKGDMRDSTDDTTWARRAAPHRTNRLAAGRRPRRERRHRLDRESDRRRRGSECRPE